eukprot:CAMPEP_0115121100 /NCGR_PEP_ID=MMETSP0227-20121206/46061_1 /TAXON_ID=89957 /ORGANISM="Polarella glacialis, Strain CCMP 1383" /LENGTH=969 /DNA_ID=CAMNT_0002522847 /DNA_START=59 /DNA_END=2964 /DNA_ORIENTATION=-
MAGNKFWGGSESSSSDSDASSSEDEKPTAATAAAAGGPRKQMARWAEESSSDEEVEAKRVVRSGTDKRYDQLMDKIKIMNNHIKIDDFATTITDYETIVKMLEKLRTVVEQDGGPPRQFLKAISALEDYVERTHAELQEKKQSKGEKLPENKQRAFNTLRAKVRKGNKQFEDELIKFKETADDFAGDENGSDGKSDASSSDSDAEAGSGSGSSSSSSGSGSDSDSDSDSGTASDSDSEESGSYKSGKGSGSESDDGDEDAAREKKMLRWLITPEKLAEREKKGATEDQNQNKKNDQKAKDEEKRERRPKKGTDTGSKETKEKTHEKDEYTEEELMKKVTEIAQQRGRRGFDRKVYIEKLNHFMTHAVKMGPSSQLYILSSMVACDFDNTGSAFASMRIDMWNEALTKVNKMLPLLFLAYKDKKDSGEELKTDDDNEDPRCFARQQELFVAYVEKLDDELYKALQFTIDVYGSEYQEILANSSKFLKLIKRTLKFFEDAHDPAYLGIVALRLMEQLYYKPDMLNAKVYEALNFTMSDEEKPDWIWPQKSQEYMAKLCHFVTATNNPVKQRRACLCQAYHLAVHDSFQPARDLMHLGNLQEQAMESDVHTQILYNRVIAQMGLCAFRLGKIQEAHNCLMDVCQYNKVRELLAQGLSYSKNMERTAEQERAERQRQLPYHMHINLEVLESAHHICGMLLEVPNMAMQAIDPNNKRVISRVLRRSLDQYDKQIYTGPPENAKESVVAAAKSLQRGEWLAACTALDDLKLWEHIDPGNPENGLKVKDMITVKVKTEALRTYLFAFSSIYDAFQLDQLVSMFSLEAVLVHSIISKMMIKEELTAFWDESSKYVLLQHVEPSSLQRLALTLADRGAQAVENNERLLDQKSGGYAFKEGGKGGDRWNDGGKGFGKGKGKGKDGKDGKGKGKGKASVTGPRVMRGWENARAGANRAGTGQRGFSTGIREDTGPVRSDR